MRVCSQLVYNEPMHKPKLDICHLYGLRIAYPKHVFSLSMCANDSQLILKIIWHIIDICRWNLVEQCVGGCKFMWKVCNCSTTPSNMGFVDKSTFKNTRVIVLLVGQGAQRFSIRLQITNPIPYSFKRFLAQRLVEEMLVPPDPPPPARLCI
jgi:hypothetical protein